MAMQAHRAMGRASVQRAQAMMRLATGLRINSAADDAAGLAIATGMKAQISGMRQAVRNAQDGISMLQTAEGTAIVVGEMVHRIRGLLVQAGNDTYDTAQRETIFGEINLIMKEINRQLGGASTFNSQEIFSPGGLLNRDAGFTLQVGADQGNAVNMNLQVPTRDLFEAIEEFQTKLDGIDLNDGAAIRAFISDTDALGQKTAALRANIGANINRLEFTVINLDISIENLSAAESRIMDADMAEEIMKLVQANILFDVATAMMAHAIQAQKTILRLV